MIPLHAAELERIATMSIPRRCLIAISAAVVAGLPVATGAGAAEGGAGFYLLGSRGPMAGFTPPPGVYFQNDTYVYSGQASVPLELGGRLVAEVDATLLANLATTLWVTPVEVAGGNLALTVTLPIGGPDVEGRIEPSPFRTSDSTFTFGDPVLGAFLGWHSGNFHWQTGVSVNVPIGDYREGEIANMSFNHWAADLYASLTWFDMQTGIELSGAAGITFNGEDPATDYRNGTEFHLEAAAVQHFGPRFDAGLVGYFYEQLTADSGAGVPPALGGFEGRVFALGATAGMNFKVGELPVSARVKYFHEFDVRNRLEGDSAFLTISFPLAAGKP